MLKVLFILAHAIPPAKARYEEACGPGVEVVPFIAPPIPGVPGGGLSSRYTAFAQKLRRGGTGPILPALLAHFGVTPGEHDAVVVGWYSAGYALARELAAADEDRAVVAGWVGIDGGHAPEEADGSPDDRSIAWLVKLCMEAAAGRTVLAYGHTDVDPIRYASTGSTIGEAMRLAAVAAPVERDACPGCTDGAMGSRSSGGLVVEAHNHHVSPTREHGAALLEWGPELAARAMVMVWAAHDVRDQGGPQDDVHAGHDAGGSGAHGSDARGGSVGALGGHGAEVQAPGLGLGELALAAALIELRAGVHEDPPGTNSGPDIERYLSGCIRDGRRIGIKSGAWCAAFAGWCDNEAWKAWRSANPQALLDSSPIEWRAAVWELVADARRSGSWREVGEYTPLPGDLAVYRRAGQDPRHRGQLGHVGRVEVPTDAAGRYTTIDGNSGPGGYRVARVEHRLPEAALVGWIAYG